MNQKEISKYLTVLILSCEKYSDLWAGQVQQLNHYWPSPDVKKIIVTDKETDIKLDGFQVFSAGDTKEWSERLSIVLDIIDTEYVLITLDDYYLIKKVEDSRISEAIDLMDQHKLDYVRLFKRPTKANMDKINNHLNTFYINPAHPYSVNLYAGIWKKKFLQFTVREPLNAWQFEVRLPKLSIEYKAKCAVMNGTYDILDVVRKGKVLRKANRYFKKHPGIYTGNRDVNTIKDEFKLTLLTLAGRYTPNVFRRGIKQTMRKHGYSFFSDDIE